MQLPDPEGGAKLQTTSDTHKVNALLEQWRGGDPSAYNELIALLYDDLRLIAHRQIQRERTSHTLQTGDLVNKLYLKLLGSKTIPWQNHLHFLRNSARTMRQILIDHARVWERRADGKAKIAYKDSDNKCAQSGEAAITRLVAISEAINQMDNLDPVMAHIADLRITLGLTLEETARELAIPINKVKREWLMVRKFIGQSLGTEMHARI